MTISVVSFAERKGKDDASALNSSSGCISILCLPELGENLLGFLTLKERCFFLGTCRYLWDQRQEYQNQVHELRVGHQDFNAVPTSPRNFVPAYLQNLMPSQRYFWSRFQSLVLLDLGPYATSEFCFLISNIGDASNSQELLPNLRHMSMARSQRLTNTGLEYLSRGENRARNLESVDITFCRNTTYEGTFVLRERLMNLRVIRRQPEWMDGQFHTPFGGASNPRETEVHTYWPDGSFHFNRSEQSSGFVCDLYEWETNNPGHVGDKLQYSDFVPPEGWPDWTRYSYRPGVSLWRLPDEKLASGEYVRCVLVVQKLHGLRPPADVSILENAQACVPLCETRYFGKNGKVVNDAQDEDSDRCYMVSRMPVYPLPTNTGLLPPKELVRQNRVICTELRHQEAVAQREELLHSMLDRT